MRKNGIMVDVDHVSVRFNKANMKIDNLKEYCIRMMKKELMFQEFMAVQDVSFQVKRGESWALVGNNGSGKSTLLKAISGIIRPYKGNVTVNGSIAPLIELGAGFDGNLTARENIFLNGCILGHTDRYMREHFEEIVDFAELWDFLDAPIKNYSSGMKARLGFAVATTVQPDLLIIDEILAVGDIRFKKKCRERIAKMREAGTTLLYVSHSMPEVMKICDNAVWLDHGVAKMIGTADEVCNAYIEENR